MDNCPKNANALEEDICKQSGQIYLIALADSDSDGVPDGMDNCPTKANDMQEDMDGDGIGDACDMSAGC